MAYACGEASWGSTNRRIAVQASANIKARPYLKNNQIKNGWRHGSGGRAPEFIPQVPLLPAKKSEHKVPRRSHLRTAILSSGPVLAAQPAVDYQGQCSFLAKSPLATCSFLSP
jgi:hypothetical protein